MAGSYDDTRSLWTPGRETAHESELASFLRDCSVDSLDGLAEFAEKQPEEFWSAVASDLSLDWDAPFTKALDSSAGVPFTTWWEGGSFNVAANAVDRHASSRPKESALFWEGDDGAKRNYTYGALAEEVGRASTVIRSLGIGKGDCVGLYLPMIPETVVLFLAISRIGAVVIPLFSGYGPGAIVPRLTNCSAKLLCTADGFLRRGKAVDMWKVADDVASQVPTLDHLLVIPRLATRPDITPGRDVLYSDAIAKAAPSGREVTRAEDPFMVIYTSGTTGRPKGTVHVHGGFPVKAMQDMIHCFDLRSTDRLLWFTDIGWMMGPWAICGMLMIGGSLVLFEGTPDFPAPDRLWDVVERHRVTALGIAPTVVRSLMQHGDGPVRSHDLTSLRILGSSGEPWNDEPWKWFMSVVGGGRCPIINYSGGTEVSGGIVAGNLLSSITPCSFSGPCPGMAASVFDESGKPVTGEVGELVIRKPWPGMTRGFWKDRERYLETYWARFPDVWVHGDWAEIASDGMWYIRGRSDDTIKVAGKRLGPAEVESLLVGHPGVLEGAAIGIPDPVKGESLALFVVLTPGFSGSPDVVREEIAALIGTELGKALKPSVIEFVPELPKTRNAKVLRRLIRAAYLGNDVGDVSSLDNTGSLAAFSALKRAPLNT